MQLVKFDENGLATQVQALPAGWMATTDDGPINDEGHRLALVNGEVTRVWDLRGFSCFGGAQGRTPMEVPNDASYVGKSWSDLSALTPPLLQSATPLTAEEQAAADAAAQAAKVSTLVVSKFQAKAALLNAGLLDKVEAAIANADQMTRLAWADAQEFRRTSPLITAVAAALDPPLTAAQVDQLFLAAVEITA